MKFMETRRLGKSNLEVSAIGLGCWAIGGPWDVVNNGDRWPAGWGEVDDAESIRAIHAGLELGINFFDTAANYGTGHSEQILGQALAGKRDQVVIATKFGHVIDEEAKTMHADDDLIIPHVRQDCENSLRRLNTDYVDIYQLHQSNYAPEKAAELIDVLEELVQEGKIRWYGWSTDLPDRARVFAQGAHCTSIQFALNLAHDNVEIRQICAEYDLAGINKSPLSRGILTGKFSDGVSLSSTDHRSTWNFEEGVPQLRIQQLEAVREIITANGHTLAQGALAYILALDERMVPIPGFRTVRQVEENAKTLELGPLSDAQVAEIQQIMQAMQPEQDSNI